MPWAPVSCPVAVSQLYWPPVLVTGTVPTTGPVTGLSRRSSIDAADVSALATWAEKLVTAPPKLTSPNLTHWPTAVAWTAVPLAWVSGASVIPL